MLQDGNDFEFATHRRNPSFLLEAVRIVSAVAHWNALLRWCQLQQGHTLNFFWGLLSILYFLQFDLQKVIAFKNLLSQTQHQAQKACSLSLSWTYLFDRVCSSTLQRSLPLTFTAGTTPKSHALQRLVIQQSCHFLLRSQKTSIEAWLHGGPRTQKKMTTRNGERDKLACNGSARMGKWKCLALVREYTGTRNGGERGLTCTGGVGFEKTAALQRKSKKQQIVRKRKAPLPWCCQARNSDSALYL